MKKKNDVIKGDLVNLTKESAAKYKLNPKTNFIYVDGFEADENKQHLSVCIGLPGEDTNYFIVEDNEITKSKDQNFEEKVITILLDISSGIKQLNNSLDETNHAQWQQESTHTEDDELKEMLNIKPKKDDFKH